MKRNVGHLNATPTKRVYSSIIADYNLRTGVCELVDNAIDQWVRDQCARPLNIQVFIEPSQQSIFIEDNAGGLEKRDLSLLVTPGSSSGTGAEESIGIFGVGTKRAVVALAQHVQIRTRRNRDKTHLIEFDDHWLKDGSWDLDIYEVDEISASSTKIELSKLRFRIEQQDLDFLREHLRATYAIYLGRSDFTLSFQGAPLLALTFENWAFPPDYSPRRFYGQLPTEDSEVLQFRAVAGLINESGSIAGEYGVYFYCNDRLIARGLKNYDVGFVAGLAGAPHNVVSLVRTIIYLNGPARCMPWNSSKSDINSNHRTFKAIQRWLTQTVTGFANVCKRLHGEWDEKIFKYPSGSYVDVEVSDFEKVKKSFLPPLPIKKVKYSIALQDVNRRILESKPWTQGVYEADVAVELIQNQRLEQKNRLALILLDSSLEIAFKDYLVNESGHHYSDAQLVSLFASRHSVESELKKYVVLAPAIWKKLKFYYGLRCKLIHERSSAGIGDDQIVDFRKCVHKVLSKLFKLKWIEQ